MDVCTFWVVSVFVLYLTSMKPWIPICVYTWMLNINIFLCMQTSVIVYTRNHKVTLRRMAATDIILLLRRDLLAHIDNSLAVIGLERDQAWNMMSLPLTTFNPEVLTPPSSSPFLPPFALWSDCINNFALPLLHYLTTNCPGNPWDSGALTPTSAVMVWILIRALFRSSRG